MEEYIINFATKIQRLIRNNVKISHLGLENVKVICGLDVAYKGEVGYAVCVSHDLASNSFTYRYVKGEVKFPYIPGYLFMREAPLMLSLLDNSKCDLVLVDGHGLAHPRMAGIATVIGVLQDLPTIGVAKSKLYGNIKIENNIEYIIVNNIKVGIKVNKFYYSIGHKTDLDDVLRIANESSGYPRVLKEADRI
ncbi:MAG: endonuclease V, partial [Sulfolobaceae archaeon]